MHHHLRGVLTHASPAQAVVEAGGVGYACTISLSTHRALPPVGSPLFLLTHLAVSESALVLYGFAEESERRLFRALLSVSGIGPAKALQVLSSTTPESFARAVEREDAEALRKIKGLGPKTAQRVLLELKGSAALLGLSRPAEGEGGADKELAARQALETLGLAPREASARVEKALAEEPGRTLEEIIRAALQ